MAYLRLADYIRSIGDAQLQQIISANDAIRIQAELEAQAEAISYLTQKYDVENEFKGILTYDNAVAYKGNDLIEYTEPAFKNTIDYVAGNRVVYLSNIYQANTLAPQGAWNSSKWDLVCADKLLFYVTLPNTEFNIGKAYKVGDIVWWKDKVYTCKIQSTFLDQQTAIQYPSTNFYPLPNAFPDDTVNGLNYWGTGTSYSVTAGTKPTDITKFTKGDNRSIQLVRKVIDICLFHLHDRISPKNIPQLRIDNYARAIAWLDMAKTGEVTADIPKRQPAQGNRMRWASQPRNINNY